MRSTVADLLTAAVLGVVGVMAISPDASMPAEMQFGDRRGCPCLTTHGFPNRTGLFSTAGHDDDCLAIDGATCYPLYYGLGTCRPWDQGYNPQCAQDSPQSPPSWCADSWCYVDPDSCDKPSKPGTLSPNNHYSYEACGFVDVYSPSKIDSKKRIRFTYMGEEFFRQFSEPVVQTNGRTIKAWRGVIPEFFNRVVELMGLEDTVEVPLTQAAIDYVKFKYNTSSVYTACAALIATNGTDWCVGDWATKERMEMAQLTISHGSDEFVMIVRPVDDHGRMENWFYLIMRPFMPFTLGAWIGYLVTILWALLVYAWLEVSPRLNASDFLAEEAAAPQQQDGFPQGASTSPSQQRHYSCLTAARRFAHLSVISLQLAASGLAILGDLAWKPMTYAGKLVYSVIQLFIVATVASYTANLAAVLSSRSTYRFDNLEQAVAARVPICLPDTLADWGDLWGFGTLARPVPSDEIVAGVDSGLCEVAIVPKLYFEASRGLYGCDEQWVATAGILYNKKSHMMAADDIIQPINTAIDRLTGQKDIVRILEQQWATAWPQVSGVPGCSDDISQQQDEGGALAFKDMAGLYLLVVAVTVAACVFELVARCCPRCYPFAQRKAYSDENPDDGPPFAFKVEAAANGWYAVAIQDQTHVKVPAFLAAGSRQTQQPNKSSSTYCPGPGVSIREIASRVRISLSGPHVEASNSRTRTEAV